MADGRNKNGGKRDGAGRKPKAEEIELIERLSPLEEVAFEKLKAGLQSGEFPYIKMFFEYRFGKPKENISLKSKSTNIDIIKLIDVDGTEI